MILVIETKRGCRLWVGRRDAYTPDLFFCLLLDEANDMLLGLEQIGTLWQGLYIQCGTVERTAHYHLPLHIHNTHLFALSTDDMKHVGGDSGEYQECTLLSG